MARYVGLDRKGGSLTTATLDWFDDGCCDVEYLDRWADVPLSYAPGQATDLGWHTDAYELVIGRSRDGKLFRKAADLLMRYQFYPQHILSHIGDFDLGGKTRWLKLGDRIVQRIHLVRLFGLPILDVVGLVEVSQTVSEPRRHGFTYFTAATHVEEGEWSAHVYWRENQDVVLNVSAISRPNPQEPARNHRLIRHFQRRAHEAGATYFKRAVLA